jgi:aspartate racemase
MKTVGIIGGIGPESTVIYYRSIVALYRQQRSDGSYPPILINSIDVTKMLGLIGAGQLEEVTEYLSGEVEKLALAGADFGLLAANTPHIVFDKIQRRSSIPLISIVDVNCQEAQRLGLKNLGLFGTRFTMRESFFPDRFAQAGLQISTPHPHEQEYIQEKYMNELIPGIILPETRDRLLQIVDRMRQEQGVDGLILGGTELPLILKMDEYKGIPFLDTTQIHVKHAIKELLS